MPLELKEVCKRFATPSGKQAGVYGLDFSVARGEGFSLLGPSGCGKTTTLRLLGGFETPDSGKLFLSGSDITKVPAQERPIRTVFQKYALFTHLSVWDNIVFGLRMQQAEAAAIKKRGEAMVELFEISHLLNRPITKLSGGEQQRVALARALITNPQVLLLDEPFAALDLKLRERLQLELLALKRKLGNTFIFVTHDQSEAMLLSDRIAVMREGKIEQIASPEVLYSKPATKFVASFIGQANFFPHAIAASLQGNVNAMPSCKSGQEWMVRAEHVAIKCNPGKDEVSLPVTLTDKIFRGQDYLLRAESAQQHAYLAHMPGKSPALEVGSSAFISWKAEDAWTVNS